MGMSSPLQRRQMVRLGVALLAVAGCGLIDTDITSVGVELPTRSYEFNATGFDLPADNSIAIPCTTDEQCIDVAVHLRGRRLHGRRRGHPEHRDEPGAGGAELGGVTGAVDISIDRIGFAVTTNTLNVDLPPVLLYMAPAGVTDPADPRAMLFGTVPSVPAGQTTNGQVQLASNAGAVFKTFTHDLSMPFTFIASTTVKVASGSGVPSGRVVFSINGRLSVSL